MLSHIPSKSFYKRIIFSIILSLFLFSEGNLLAQGNAATTGAGYCLDFTANMTKGSYVDLGPLVAIDTGNFSIEMWVNVNTCKGDPAFFSNKDWSAGSNPGIVFDVHDNGTKLRINLKSANSSFQNIIIPIDAIGRGWFHLAVTLDRATTLKVYIDGILKNTTYVENLLLGSFASPYTYKLGQDGTGAYSDNNNVLLPYDGKIDEIRFWKVERTEEQIKENMCKRISALSPNLYAYYSCDTTSGNAVRDLKNLNQGKWIKGIPSSWKISGAAIGDMSIALYPESQDWNGKELALKDSLFGNMKIKNILGVEGLHLYKVNKKPNSLMGLNTFSDNSTYYGVFLAGVTYSSKYDIEFDYTPYAKAVKDEKDLKLFTRNENSDHLWSDYMAIVENDKKIITKQNIERKREYILGTKTGILCNASTAIKMGVQTDTSCLVGWTSGSLNWNTEWGQQGFELGTGQTLTNSTLNPQKVMGLKAGSFYEFYVQDKCTASSESYWVGPFLFYSQSCLSPSNYMASHITENSALLTWKGNGYKSDVEWGLQGFTLGQGIPDSTFTDSLYLRNLSPNTSYAYFVKSNCPAGTNNFNGPFTFKTSVKLGVNENELLSNVNIYPNPSSGEFTMLINTSAKQINVRIYNVLGKEILNSKEVNKNGNITQTYMLGDKPKGIYFINITDGVNTRIKPLIIQ
ncbi:MAG: LamG-like jellyroll fold domain-containing protein [Bacteroidia bacterium]